MMNIPIFSEMNIAEKVRLLKNNFGLKSDSYKFSHASQYPPGTTNVISYMEARGSDHPLRQEVAVVGMQANLIKHFVGVRMTKELLDIAEMFSNAHFGLGLDGKTPAVPFNRKGWEYIIENHGGKLPLRIKSVPEGMVVPLKEVISTFEITDNHSFWLTNFSETLLSHNWFPITIASNSREMKKILKHGLELTADPGMAEILLPTRLVDFGFRGVETPDAAGVGGMAHLVNFESTDNTAGIIEAMIYYNAGMIGSSIPASEHSTITSWGKENESKAIGNLLDSYRNAKYVASVSDSFDIFNAARKIYGEDLKDKILVDGKVVLVRPDSGDPIEVNRKVIKILWDKFGGHVNSRGFKVLDPHIRIIQGDGIDIDSLQGILDMLIEEKFSTEIIAFGSGGGLLQKFDRDTFKFAIKCSMAIVNGEEVDVQKDPITSKGKKSKPGRLKLVRGKGGVLYTASSKTHKNFEELEDVMELIFENGEMVKTYDIDEIRERASL